MNAPKHTRGPWQVEPAGVDGDLDYGAAQRDGSRALLQLHVSAPKGGGGRIGRVFSNCLVTTEEAMLANALVFAAAPEMLKALQEFDAAFTEFDPESAESRKRMRLAVIKARAAIAKATGGAQ